MDDAVPGAAADPSAAADGLHPVIAHHITNTLQWRELRPLQQAAVEPVTAGRDCLLLAPTAGGKTEAAMLPLLSNVQNNNWSGLSILYVCPLRALVNNLAPRLDSYCRWLGRRARAWHGDTTPAMRKAILADPPDVLLTTPESLEAMLVSASFDARGLLGGVRAAVVDEIHAFAGDDRGVHLRSVLERIARLSTHGLQRIGLSATVGNPPELLTWLQGENTVIPGDVVAPDAPMAGRSGDPCSEKSSRRTAQAAADAEVTVDYVGSMDNAATLLRALHRGEKRLVFVDSRRHAEQLAAGLGEQDLHAFVSHSSLSAAERSRTEKAFAESTGAVIVATSTLELGIDIGDVDSVVQIGAPSTVSSFLQRLGRSGRRAGTARSMLFLCLEDDHVLQALGLLILWRQGYVEPVTAPPVPRHLLAQQILALCLQDGRIGRSALASRLAAFDAETLGALDDIVDHLVSTGHLDVDQQMLFVGPEAQNTYGRFYFRDLVSSFTSPPQFTVLHGRHQIGTVDPMLVTRRVSGTRRLLLAGRSWEVLEIDWGRKRLYVEPGTTRGEARWQTPGNPLGYALVDAMRQVLLRADPDDIEVSQRAVEAIARVRASHGPHVDHDGTVVVPRDANWLSWWTWAGGKGNVTLASVLDEIDPGLVSEEGRASNTTLRISSDAGTVRLRRALPLVRTREEFPIRMDPRAVRGLKFHEMLPEALALDTLARRTVDADAAKHVAAKAVVDRTAR